MFKNNSNHYILSEHEHFLHWTRSKKMHINYLKCKCLIVNSSRNVSHCNIPDIQFVNELKLLGVVFNCKFNFNSHVSYVVNNCTRKLFALRVVRRHLSATDSTLIYNGLIRSLLEYCSPLFVALNSSNCCKLESIQNRAHKIIHGKSCNCHTFKSLYSRRISAAVKLFLNCAKNHDNVLFSIVPSTSRYRTNRFIQPVSKSSRRLNSFIPFVTDIVNNL